MAVLQHVGTWFGGSFDLPTAAVSIRGVAAPGGALFEISDFAHLSTNIVSVAGTGAPQTQTTLWHIPEDRIAVTVGSVTGSLPGNAVANAFAAWDAGERSAELSFLGQGAEGAQAVSLMAARIGGTDMLIVAGQGGGGVTCLPVSAGLPGDPQQLGSAGGLYMADIADMAVVETATATHLFAASASGNGIAGFTFDAGGTATVLPGLGMQQSLPVSTVTALETAQVGGQDFLIAAASGSSSLSVMAVSDTGGLSVTDHLIDDLGTRFQGVAQLETVSVGGHVFVLASGMDDGLSLFRLTAEGRLVHQSTFADSLQTALQGLSGLGALAGAGGIDVLTTSGNEAGLSRFRIAFTTPGTVAVRASGVLEGTDADDLLSLRSGAGRIAAGAGNDILSDGRGQDSLHGGSGADIFVLRADGERDVIEDLEVGRDLVDLSAWPMLYALSQIAVEFTDWGAVLRFGTEELALYTSDGTALTQGRLASVLAGFLSHVDVVTGPLQLSTDLPGDGPFVPPPPDPEPETEPDPEPEPGPDPDPPPGGGQVISGTPGNDTLSGGAGHDLVSGAEGNDVLDGGGGNDTIAASDGNDSLRGGPGDDAMGGGPGNDSMQGNDGNDAMGGGLGNDTMDGGRGRDLLSGGPGDDLLIGGPDDDMLAGSFGNDTVDGGSGNDDIGGGTGRDDLHGGDGNDSIGGGEGDDTVEGGNGNDFLAGGGRNDALSGRDGADTLNGGTGDDVLRGGAGADMFVFNAMTPGEYDVIPDFTPGTDRLRLNGIAGATPAARFDALSFEETGQGVELSYQGHIVLLRDLLLEDIDSGDFMML